MVIQNNIKTILIYYFPFIAAFFLGSFLRLYGIEKQIPLDDEWHGLFAAAVNSYAYLASHLFYSGISIPYTLYQKLALSTVGWDEITVRLPSIAAGILSLLICPFYVNRMFGKRIAVIFSFLLALSPLLVFYSRCARSYSVIMLLSFVALLSFYYWITTENRQERNIFITSSVLSVYFHLFAIVPFFSMFLYVFFLPTKEYRLRVSSKYLFFTGCLCLVAMAALYMPALINSSQSFLSQRVNIDHPNIKSFLGFVDLLLGVSNKGSIIGILVFLFFGQVIMFKKHKLAAGLFSIISVGLIIAIVITSPPSMQVSLQIARYGILIFPLSFILIALGLDSLINILQDKCFSKNYVCVRLMEGMIITAFGFCIFWVGPLPNIYFATKNFTNHSAYQESYVPLNKGEPYVSQPAAQYRFKKGNMSQFYQILSNEKADLPILEYPMPVGDYFNFYYFYQRLHGKDVLVGYHPSLTLSTPRATDIIAYGNFPIDFILNNIKDESKLKFKTIINMLNIAEIKTKNIRYIILHKDLFQEGFNLENLKFESIAKLASVYQNTFGKPIFEDQWIVVFGTKERAL